MKYSLRDYDEQTYDRVVRIGGRILDFFLVNSISISGQEKLKEISRENSVIITANHKSRIDFLLLPIIARNLGLEALCIAAGKDVLDVPIREQMIAMRAFPVPRTKQEITVSSIKELNYNIETILSNKQHLLFFPEGGRSYDGIAREIQAGLIEIIASQSLKNKHSPYFVPTLMTYDRVVEDEIFSSLDRTKSSESFKADVNILLKTMLLHRKINADIKFGEPYQIFWGEKNKPEERNKPRVPKELPGLLSEHINSEWKKMLMPTPTSVVCHSIECYLKDYPEAPFLKRDLNRYLNQSVADLNAAGKKISFLRDSYGIADICEEGLKHLIQPFRKIISRRGNFYFIENRSVIQYYARQFREIAKK
ncbi:MAG TPA: 1-acyl-sn-glycerol-3-phosphate acyltransferase [Candidatus Nanoarchaeia archaeon]|nr:1-acyl-sn-glycerol-3-phosphate acyltransferase [Candidatus Nanoarchaeia archaeon]